MEKIAVEDLDLEYVVPLLRAGRVVIYPTETVAGIGCIGSDLSAVRRVFTAKQREMNKPVSYAFSSKAMVAQYAHISHQAEKLFTLLPGPLTMVLPLRADHPDIYGIDSVSIGVRIPDVPWLIELISRLDEPVMTTSANRSGEPPARSITAIDTTLFDHTDLLLTWKNTLDAASSTVVSLIDKVEILREGAIPVEVITTILNS